MIRLLDYGVYIDYDQSDYNKASRKLRALNNGCTQPIEDNLMQIIRSGGKLIIRDDVDNSSIAEITLDKVHEQVPSIPYPILLEFLINKKTEGLADAIIQYVAFGEMIMYKGITNNLN